MDTQTKGLKLAYFFAVLNAAIIGFSFLFTKMALVHAHPIDTLTYRFAASFIVLSIPVALGWVKLSYRGKPIFKALLLALMYPLGFFTLQAFGLQHATSAEGGIMYAFTPVVTMIIASLFLKETTTLLQKLSIFLSVFGVVFIFIMKGSSFNLSNLGGLSMLFLTCVAFAGYSVLARSLSKHFSPAEISYFMMGIGFITFFGRIAHETYSRWNAEPVCRIVRQRHFRIVHYISWRGGLAYHFTDCKLCFVQNRGIENERIYQSVDHRVYRSRGFGYWRRNNSVPSDWLVTDHSRGDRNQLFGPEKDSTASCRHA